jgi:ATP-dependent DNA ligase
MRAQPLFRRRALHYAVPPGRGLQLIEHVEMHGEALFGAIAADDHEGIVAKRLDPPYRAGRQPCWVKVKNRDYSRREAVEWQGR